MAEECSSCRYYRTRASESTWYTAETETKEGECRIRAPVFTLIRLPSGNVTRGDWPPVKASDWCGEYSPVTGWEAAKKHEQAGAASRDGTSRLR